MAELLTAVNSFLELGREQCRTNNKLHKTAYAGQGWHTPFTPALELRPARATQRNQNTQNTTQRILMLMCRCYAHTTTHMWISGDNFGDSVSPSCGSWLVVRLGFKHFAY